MRTLTVALGNRSYPIHIGSGLIDRSDLFAPHIQGRRALIVTNETVAPLYLQRLKDSLRGSGIEAGEVILPDGERYKTWETLNLVFDALLGAHCERSTTLLALGGGVVGDMGGFAAACYQRGMPFIQVPTTLLAQVDSSVGGKTAINHPLGKNMIGAFYQPRAVIADVATLATLADRELRAGLAEVIKYGLIRDPDFLGWLDTHLEQLLARNEDALTYAIECSCAIKAAIVAADETETGERALLNLGHTFGHAIETGMGYGAWLHGEAVAAGTVMAAKLSAARGFIGQNEVEHIEHLFSRAGLPIRGPQALTPAQYHELMSHDKKVQNGRLRLVLLQKIGRACIDPAAGRDEIEQAIRDCR